MRIFYGKIKSASGRGCTHTNFKRQHNTTIRLHTSTCTSKAKIIMGNSISNQIAAKSQMDPIAMEDLIALGGEWKYTNDDKNHGILRSVSGMTSVVSSSTIIWMILRSHNGLSTIQHRLLLGLCISDLISSSSLSTFNVMVPSEIDYYVWNARGNEATCDAQGFLISMGTCSGLWYNASLNLYYLAAVKFEKDDGYIRSRMEPFFHGVPIVGALAISIAFLVGGHYNSDAAGYCGGNKCHYPPHCHGYDVGEIRDGFEIPCGRGIESADTAKFTIMIAMFLPAIIMSSSLISIYSAVKRQEKKISRYGISTLRLNTSTNSYRVSQRTQSQQSRAVMHKAFGYSFAWFLSFGMYIILVILTLLGIDTSKALYVTHVCLPLQGFFNLIIYLYPKVISARKKSKRKGENISWCRAISRAIWSRGNNRPLRRSRNRNSSSTNGSRRRMLTSTLQFRSSSSTNGSRRHMLTSALKFRNSSSTNGSRRHMLMSTPHFPDRGPPRKIQTMKNRKKHCEEEEKCEIQSLVDTIPYQKTSNPMFAPNHVPTIDGQEMVDEEVTNFGESENKNIELQNLVSDNLKKNRESDSIPSTGGAEGREDGVSTADIGLEDFLVQGFDDS